jgi:rifampicin phosphotransferase
MKTPRFSVDTPPVTGEAVLSAANFREVAPEILSPLSFSLIGAGMELAFRAVAEKTGIVIEGPNPEYLAFRAFRPYHVMSEIDKFVARMPVMTRSDVWELLLGGPPPLAGEPKEEVADARRIWNAVKVGLLLGRGNGEFSGRTAAQVARAEDAVRGVLADGSPIKVGSAFELAFTAARTAWALHTRTTTLAAAAASAMRHLFLEDYDEATATELLRVVARRAGEAAYASATAGRLPTGADRLQNYEVADRSDRFAPFRIAKEAAQPLGGSAMTGGHHGEAVALPNGTIAGRTANKLVDLLDSLLAERERSKELGLRALHCVRLLLESGATGIDPGDAALLGATELTRLERRAQQRLVDARAEELQEAATLALGPDVQEKGEDLVNIPRNALTFVDTAVGTPLAPGWAEGPLMIESDGSGKDVICGERVDGNYVLAVQPAGVITAFGSILSHVAIVCRELGIPLVAGISIPESQATGLVVVDGWSGRVFREAA